ncbi:MAG: large subunit ribosomal protein [Actinomycetota bacterium]|nr:large subunit ribosomal protein [Actinomycetota bacterium]
MADENRPEKPPRAEKVAVVAEVRDRLSSSNGAVLTEYRGLKVGDLARLRHAVREAGGEYRIFKNTLTRLACRDLGLEDLEPLLVGPTAVAFVDGDPVAVAKALRDFARTNVHLTVKGGVLGRKVLTGAEAAALADVAPREVILAQLAGALAAPLQKMAGLLQALPRNFAYGLSALIDQKTAAGDTSGADTAVAATEAAAPAAGAAPEAAAPEPAAPDAVAPEAPAPDASTPETSAPDPTPPEAAVPEPAVPEPAAPEAAAPEAAAPEAAAPEATTAETPEETSPEETRTEKAGES